MRHLLDDHLEIARQHEQPLALTLEDVRAEGLLEEVTEPLRGEAALRGVELNVQVAARDLSMRVDARQTRRALCHLLTAALAATPDGGAVRSRRRAIMGTRIGDEGKRFVIISISDSSQGIPPEEVPFVFDAFWQASDTAALASRASASPSPSASRPRTAATSPCAASAVAARSTRSCCRRASRSRSRRCGAILIVDDAPELLLLLRKLVARMGYQVEMASGAQEALEILRGEDRLTCC